MLSTLGEPFGNNVKPMLELVLHFARRFPDVWRPGKAETTAIPMLCGQLSGGFSGAAAVGYQYVLPLVASMPPWLRRKCGGRLLSSLWDGMEAEGVDGVAAAQAALVSAFMSCAVYLIGVETQGGASSDTADGESAGAGAGSGAGAGAGAAAPSPEAESLLQLLDACSSHLTHAVVMALEGDLPGAASSAVVDGLVKAMRQLYRVVAKRAAKSRDDTGGAGGDAPTPSRVRELLATVWQNVEAHCDAAATADVDDSDVWQRVELVVRGLAPLCDDEGEAGEKACHLVQHCLEVAASAIDASVQGTGSLPPGPMALVECLEPIAASHGLAAPLSSSRLITWLKTVCSASDCGASQAPQLRKLLVTLCRRVTASTAGTTPGSSVDVALWERVVAATLGATPLGSPTSRADTADVTVLPSEAMLLRELLLAVQQSGRALSSSTLATARVASTLARLVASFSISARTGGDDHDDVLRAAPSRPCCDVLAFALNHNVVSDAARAALLGHCELVLDKVLAASAMGAVEDGLAAWGDAVAVVCGGLLLPVANGVNVDGSMPLLSRVWLASWAGGGETHVGAHALTKPLRAFGRVWEDIRGDAIVASLPASTLSSWTDSAAAMLSASMQSVVTAARTLSDELLPRYV